MSLNESLTRRWVLSEDDQPIGKQYMIRPVKDSGPSVITLILYCLHGNISTLQVIINTEGIFNYLENGDISSVTTNTKEVRQYLIIKW